jgi:hypothetical protein
VGIRQTLNDNPVITSSVTGVIILAAIFFLFRSACSGGGEGFASAPKRQYFTIDDGATYFPEDATKVPPFTHQGKPAYRVKVYKCRNGTTYVSHLERYNEADKKRIESAPKPKDPSASPMFDPLMLGTMEIKKPGDKEWVTPMAGPEKYAAIMRPRCPDGSFDVTPVFPPD